MLTRFFDRFKIPSGWDVPTGVCPKFGWAYKTCLNNADLGQPTRQNTIYEYSKRDYIMKVGYVSLYEYSIASEYLLIVSLWVPLHNKKYTHIILRGFSTASRLGYVLGKFTSCGESRGRIVNPNQMKYCTRIPLPTKWLMYVTCQHRLEGG